MQVEELYGPGAVKSADRSSPNQSAEHKGRPDDAGPAATNPRAGAEAMARAPEKVNWASKYDPIKSPYDLDAIETLKDRAGAKNIVEFHKIGSADHEENYATLCQPHRNHIGVFIRNEDDCKNVFNTGYAYHFFGIRRFFGGFNKAIGVKYYKDEGYVNLIDQNADPESIKHIRDSFKNGEYSAMALYSLDEKTDKFNKQPDAVAILHNYGQMQKNMQEGINLPKGISQAEKDAMMDWAKQHPLDPQLENTHACNLILVNPSLKEKLESKDEIRKICTMIAEGMPAQSSVIFPVPIWNKPEAVSQLKRYSELNWKHIEVRDEELELADHPLTMVTSLQHAQEPIANPAAFDAVHTMHRMLQMHRPEDMAGASAKLREAHRFNIQVLKDYNQAISA